MRGTAAIPVGVIVTALLSGCQASPKTPTSPAPLPINMTGTWNGTGADSFGPERVTWVLTQSGTTVSGTAELKAADPLDGSCGSCHKVKKGTFAGTLSGTSLSIAMTFPAGGDVPAPICVAELTGTATVAVGRITASYTGTDTCEGIYTNGTMELTR